MALEKCMEISVACFLQDTECGRISLLVH